MITSRTRRLSLSIAEQFTALLRDIPLIETVTEPTRLQTGHGISSKIVENAASNLTDSHWSSRLVGQISCSLSSRFQTASSLVKNGKKDDVGKNETNAIDAKKGNCEENGKKNYDGNNQNHKIENENRFCFVKRNTDGVKSTDVTAKRSSFTATAHSALPVRKPSKFIIPQRIDGSVLNTSKSENKSKNCSSNDNIVTGKRKSSEIGGNSVNTNTNIPIMIISESCLGDRDDGTKLSHDEQQKEKKSKLDGKRGHEKKGIAKKTVMAIRSTIISELGSKIDSKSTEVKSSEISAMKQKEKSAAKNIKSSEIDIGKAKIVKKKTSEKSVVEKAEESLNQDSESEKISQTVNTATNKNKKEKKKKIEKKNKVILVANNENARTKGKKNGKQAEIFQNTADPVPHIPDHQNWEDDSSGDDSLSLGSENENIENNNDNDDDLLFED
jgi:hypothetical protein